MAEIQTPPCATKIDLTNALEQFRRDARQKSFDTGRYRCEYVEWGEGPPLVVIPGLCEEPLSFVMPMARLKSNFRCIAYNLPAGGGDGAKLGKYTHDDLVADLMALADHCRLGKVVLLGASFGSTVVLKTLAAQPERFVKGILQGGFAKRPLAPAELLLARMARYWPGRLKHIPFRAASLGSALLPTFKERPPEVWQYYLERSGTPRMAAVARRALLMQALDLRPLLPKIAQPVLLICGDYDPLVNKQCEADLMSGLPHATRAEIENCGHYPQFTQPEVMVELIQRFLGVGGSEGCP